MGRAVAPRPRPLRAARRPGWWRCSRRPPASACADVREKAAALASDEVAVVELDAVAQRDLHERYGIDAVPMVLVADAGGIVRRDFVGPVTATDLWAAVAELREPGSVPPGCDGTVCG
ncbi:MAG: hypothetical protein R2711_14115 [Acidimicrobiales bacterium]